MSFKQAFQKAAEKAKSTKQFIYVFDEGYGFEIGTDFDCETWFAGSEPVACFGPDGEQQ